MTCTGKHERHALLKDLPARCWELLSAYEEQIGQRWLQVSKSLCWVSAFVKRDADSSQKLDSLHQAAALHYGMW